MILPETNAEQGKRVDAFLRVYECPTCHEFRSSSFKVILAHQMEEHAGFLETETVPLLALVKNGHLERVK